MGRSGQKTSMKPPNEAASLWRLPSRYTLPWTTNAEISCSENRASDSGFETAEQVFGERRRVGLEPAAFHFRAQAAACSASRSDACEISSTSASAGSSSVAS